MAMQSHNDGSKFVEMEAELARRLAALETLGSVRTFNPGCPVFFGNRFMGVNRHVSELWKVAGPRIVRMLDWFPLVYRPDYVRDCVESGAVMMPIFVNDGGRLDCGLIDVSMSPDGEAVITGFVHTPSALDLRGLASFLEIAALMADVSAVAIWSTVECPLVPGYQMESAGDLARWQLMRIKPIQ